MIRLEEMRFVRSKSMRFLSDIDGTLLDLKVAAGHRTAVTCLAFGEVFARAATMKPMDMKTAEFYRTAILPAVQNLCDGVVEIISVDAEQILKATYAAYEYRCDQAYPCFGSPRPSIEEYAHRFETPIQEVIKAYPDLPNHHWVIEDLFRSDQRLI